jgi:hypothetical protein
MALGSDSGSHHIPPLPNFQIGFYASIKCFFRGSLCLRLYYTLEPTRGQFASTDQPGSECHRRRTPALNPSSLKTQPRSTIAAPITHRTWGQSIILPVSGSSGVVGVGVGTDPRVGVGVDLGVDVGVGAEVDVASGVGVWVGVEVWVGAGVLVGTGVWVASAEVESPPTKSCSLVVTPEMAPDCAVSPQHSSIIAPTTTRTQKGNLARVSAASPSSAAPSNLFPQKRHSSAWPLIFLPQFGHAISCIFPRQYQFTRIISTSGRRWGCRGRPHARSVAFDFGDRRRRRFAAIDGAHQAREIVVQRLHGGVDGVADQFGS